MPGNEIFSVSGCKRISQKVGAIVEREEYNDYFRDELWSNKISIYQII